VIDAANHEAIVEGGKWYYWTGSLLDWMVSGWILDELDQCRRSYWIDWIITRKSSWIQQPESVSYHVTLAKHQCGVVCHDCVYRVTVARSQQSGFARCVTARLLRSQ
jgi:hypothetical protein